MNADPKGLSAGVDRDWTTAPLQELIHYLSVDEHSLIRSELLIIEQKLRRLVMLHGAEFPALCHLPQVFAQLCSDLQTHMYLEETELFPAIQRYVGAVEAGQPMKSSPLNAFGGPLRVMEHEHETIGAALRLLREFGMNYAVPSDCSPEYTEAMQRLSTLEDLLLHHIYLENNVLYARAAAMKASRIASDLKV